VRVRVKPRDQPAGNAQPISIETGATKPSALLHR
jgi:hypothetical protein